MLNLFVLNKRSFLFFTLLSQPVPKIEFDYVIIYTCYVIHRDYSQLWTFNKIDIFWKCRLFPVRQ